MNGCSCSLNIVRCLSWLVFKGRLLDGCDPCIMAIDDDWYIDAEYPSASNWCRYVNHSSKKENLVVVRDVPARRCVLVTTRAIDAHEELYLDYGPNYWKPAHNRMLDDVLYYGAEYKAVLAEEPD